MSANPPPFSAGWTGGEQPSQPNPEPEFGVPSQQPAPSQQPEYGAPSYQEPSPQTWASHDAGQHYGQPASDPPQNSGDPEQPKPKKLSRSKLIAGLIGFAVGVIATALFMTLIFPGHGKPNVDAPKGDYTVSAKNPSETTIRLGQLEVKIESIVCEGIKLTYYEPKGKFCAIKFHAKNTGFETSSFGYRYQVLHDKQGMAHEPASLQSIAYNRDQGLSVLDSTLPKGEETKVFTVYDIPVDANLSYLVISEGSPVKLGDVKTIIIKD